MRKKLKGKCPICDREYHKGNIRERHHLFPKAWYRIGVILFVCYECHHYGFNIEYPMVKKTNGKGYIRWSEKECVQNWVDFCYKRGKYAYEIYPELNEW